MTTFVRSILKLSGARAIATAVPFLSAPLLGRLYTPAEYSDLTLFLSINTVIAVFATFQMQNGLLLEAGHRSAVRLAWICLGISLGVASFVALGTVILAFIRGFGKVWGWMFLLPLGTLLIGLMQVTNLFATRLRSFSFLARVLVVQVIATATASILFGYWLGGSVGLFLGFFFGQLVQASQQILFLRQNFEQTGLPTKSRTRALARRHRDFVFFSTPSALIQSLAIELPTFALSALSMTGAVGAFGRARQVIAAPVNLARASVSQVFQREAAELYRTTGSCRGLMLKTAAWLFAIGVVPAVLLAYFGPSLITLYLGPDWEQAGIFAQMLAPMLLARFVTAPTASVFFATGHQRLEAKLAVAALVLVATGVGLALLMSQDATGVVIGFAATTTAVYFMYFIFAVRIASR